MGVYLLPSFLYIPKWYLFHPRVTRVPFSSLNPWICSHCEQFKKTQSRSDLPLLESSTTVVTSDFDCLSWFLLLFCVGMVRRNNLSRFLMSRAWSGWGKVNKHLRYRIIWNLNIFVCKWGWILLRSKCYGNNVHFERTSYRFSAFSAKIKV